VAHRLGCKACEPHTCPCGKAVDARGLHGLCCRRGGPRHQRHHQMNDIVWRAIKRVQIPATKEPVSLIQQNGKRPDSTTLLPWARGKPMAWDVTVPDTYAESHIDQTAREACSNCSLLSCKQGSSEQDCKVWRALCLSHLLGVPNFHILTQFFPPNRKFLGQFLTAQKILARKDLNNGDAHK